MEVSAATFSLQQIFCRMMVLGVVSDNCSVLMRIIDQCLCRVEVPLLVAAAQH